MTDVYVYYFTRSRGSAGVELRNLAQGLRKQRTEFLAEEFGKSGGAQYFRSLGGSSAAG